jgi:hypothetical protein
MNLHQRLNEVRKHNAYIKKDKRVDGGGYMAVTHDAVTAALRDDLVKQGVLVIPSLVPGTAHSVDTGTKTAKGVPFIRVEAEYDVAFVNVDDPKDREVMRLVGHAIDQGDKAPGKLVSYIVKAALLKVFSIESGEDDESRNPDREGDTLPEEDEKKFGAEIDAIKDSAKEGPKLWERIQAKCEEVGDMQARTRLRARLSSKVSELKKAVANGAKQPPAKGNGGANAGAR